MNSITTKILTVAVLVCVLMCLLRGGYQMLNREYETETAKIYTLSDSTAFKGIYIRDEDVVEYGGTGVVSYCVADGGKLGAGSKIAEIYGDESQVDIKEQISELEAEVALLEKIENPGTIESAQPASIATLINEQYRTMISNRELKNVEDVLAEKNDLLISLSTYQMVTDSNVGFTDRINEINAEISNLKLSETVPLDTILADYSAYFVSYADGYEDTLTLESIDTITPEIINEVEDSGPVSNTNAIGKLINGYEWYIAGIIDNTKINYSAGDSVKVKFQSTSDTVDGVIYDIRKTDDASQSIFIIKCDELTYDLVQHRAERIEIVVGEYGGLKVPRKAIRFADVTQTVTDPETGEEKTVTESARGVYVKLGERISFKQIDVIYEGSDYVLSSLNGGDGFLSLYDDIVVKGVDADGN